MLSLKTATFGDFEISYDSRVLEPRLWTRLQSEWAAELSLAVPQGPILELCAGAGHIGLLAATLSGRPLVQIEADPVAASFATANAMRAGMSVEVRNVTIANALQPAERFPLILADPPYLPTPDIDAFPADPRRAIDGGKDGLDVVRECLAVANQHLELGGALLLQLRGPSQAEQVARLLDRTWPGLTRAEVRGPDAQRAVLLVVHTTSGMSGSERNG